MRKYVVWLLISLFCLIDLSGYADIIYLGLDSSEDNDIVYLKNGNQIKGRIIERDPEQVKIEVTSVSISGSPKNIFVYGADEVKMVEVRSSKNYADIIYLEREIVVGWVSVEDSDIVHLKNGKQIKGKVVERSPQQVKIEVTSESQKKVLNHEMVYRADEVEKVEIRLAKKKTSSSLKELVGCVGGCGGLMILLGLAMAPGPG